MSRRLAIVALLGLVLIPAPVARDGPALTFATLAEERTQASESGAEDERPDDELEDGEPSENADETTAESEPDDEASDDEAIEPVRSPDIFVPSEDISEDLEVTFPVDI